MHKVAKSTTYCIKIPYREYMYPKIKIAPLLLPFGIIPPGKKYPPPRLGLMFLRVLEVICTYQTGHATKKTSPRVPPRFATK